MPTVERTPLLATSSLDSETSKTSGEVKISPFSMDGAMAHIAHKAGYKALGNGQHVKAGRCHRLKCWVLGNAAVDRYQRANYEGGQMVSVSVCAEEYRQNLGNKGPHQDLDIQNNALVRSRFARQDNLRCNTKFAGEHYGMNRMGKVATWTSRIAHWCNGITELGAAPTGMLLKISKLLAHPKCDEQSHPSQFRVLGALVLVTAAVAMVSVGLFRELVNERGLAPAMAGLAQGLAANVISIVASFSAMAFLGAVTSGLFTGISSLAAKGLELTPKIVEYIQRNKSEHVKRLSDLMDKIRDRPELQDLVGEAMTGRGLYRKISNDYLLGESQGGRPKLLQMLLDATANCTDKAASHAAIQKTIGKYMVLKDMNGPETTDNALDADGDLAELLKREKHVIALTNLIEHSRIASDSRGSFKDIRHRIEDGAVWCKSQVVNTILGNGFEKMGLTKCAEVVRHADDATWQDRRNVDKRNPLKAQDMRFSMDNILQNPHQYGSVTRFFAKATEAIRFFNHAVVLSLNYQVTRPFAWAFSKFTEHVLHMPPCRFASFTVGRGFSSAGWAVADAMLFISLAGGAGVANSAPHGTLLDKTLPWKVDMGAAPSIPIAVISTGAQMLLAAFTTLPFMLATRIAISLEGWAGPTQRPIEPINSSRKPIWL